jgi:8-oxo-dGTP diphosphatase
MTTDVENRKTPDAPPNPSADLRASPHWPKAAASIAVIRDGSVLLVERGKPPRAGLWSLPGGHIEAGETAANAALRELREETGVTAELAGLVDILDVITHDDITHDDGPGGAPASGTGAMTAHFLLAVFCGRWISGAPVPASDSRSARFVPLSDLGQYPMTPSAEAMIMRAAKLVVAKTS